MKKRRGTLRGNKPPVRRRPRITRTRVSRARGTRASPALSQSQYRALFETMAQGVVYQDARGRVTAANPAAERILGLTLEQMKGRTSHDPRWKTIREDGSELPGAEHPAMVALRTGKPVRDVPVGVYHPAENAYRWILVSAVPQFRRGESKPYQVYASFTDITERKNAEQALRKGDERFRSTFEQAAVGMTHTALDGRFLRVNRRFCEIVGLTPEEAMATTFQDITHPDDLEADLHLVRQVLAGEIETYSMEKRYLRKDGGAVWVRLTVSLCRESTGEPAYFISVVEDISGRKRAEEERDRLFDRSVDMLCIAGFDGYFQQLNPAWEQTLGWSRQELLSRPWLDFVHPDDREATIAAGKELVEGRPVHAFENRYLCRDGSYRWVSWNSFPLQDTGQILGVARDVTRQKQSEAALRRIEWLLEPKRRHEAVHEQPYGDPAEFNRSRVILDSVGPELLRDIVNDFLDLLGTSAAVYERNGDYALGIFASGWYRLLDEAAFRLCKTDSLPQALACGRWRCHESCWNQASRRAVEAGKAVDIECEGGIRLHAVPIWANGEIVGSINCGYGDPPRDAARIREIADRYGLDPEELRRAAEAYETRPPFIIGLAKSRLASAARFIGAMVERRAAEAALRESQQRLRNLIDASPMGTYMYRLHPDGRLVLVDSNAAADRMTGVETRKRHGKTIEEAFPSLAQTEIPERYRLAAREGVPWQTTQFSYEDQEIKGAFDVHAFQTAPGEMAVQFLDATQVKQAQEAIRRSEAELASIFRAAPVGIGLVSNRVFLKVNERICRMTGYTADELVGRNARILYPSDEDYEWVGQEKYRQIRETGTGTVETRWRRKDGGIIDVLLSSTPIVAGDLSAGVTFTALDITERKQTVEALKLSNERLRMIAETSSSVLTGAQFGEQASAEARRIREAFGVDLCVIRTLDGDDLVLLATDGDSPEPVPERLSKPGGIAQAILSSRRAMTIADVRQDVRTASLAVSRPGHYEFISYAGAPLLHAGEVIGILGVYTARQRREFTPTDLEHLQIFANNLAAAVINQRLYAEVTHQKEQLELDVARRERAEAVRSEALARFSGFAEASQYGMGMADLDGRITFVNPTLVRLLGEPSAEACLGKHFPTAYYAPEMTRRLQDEVMPALMREGHWHGELELLTADGRRVPTDENYFVIRDEQGRPRYLADILTDITERKEAEAEVQKLAAVVRNSGELVNLATPDGKMTFLNEAGSRMLGIDPREVESHSILEVIPEACRPVVDEILLPALLKGGSWEGDLQYRNLRTGALTDVHAMAFAINDPQTGKPLYFANVSLDITERKRAEEERARLTAILENASDLVSMASPDERLVYLNAAGRLMAGWDESEDPAGHVVADLHPAWAYERIRDEGLPAAFKTGTWEGETAILHRRGREIPVSQLIMAHRSPDGRLQYLSTIMRDITERKRAEEVLRASELFLSETQKIARLGGWKANVQTDYLEWTDGIYDIIELPRDYRPGLADGLKCYLPEYIPILREKVADCAATKAPFAVEAEVITGTGKKLWVEVRGLAPIVEGERSYVLGTFQDITDRKMAELERERLLRELEEKNRELESLLYAASHDLRSPLVNIQGFAHQLEIICQELTEAFARRELIAAIPEDCATIVQTRIPTALRYIRTSGTKMDALLNGLLRICRTGRVALHLENLDMNRLLEAVMEAMEFQTRAAAAVVDVEPLPSCLGDSAQINQVFTNLVDNALKYRDPNRPLRVRITGRIDGGCAVYCVEDNGLGIDRAHQANIWNLFHRLDPRGPQAGEGIGLTLVRRVVERHNGRAWVESEPRQGSRFFVALPAAC